MVSRFFLLAVLVASSISCSERNEDEKNNTSKFNKEMSVYLADESKLAEISDAIDGYRAKKAAKEAEDKKKAEEAKLEEQLKNPVKINIGNSPVRGSANAKVTIVEFSDFQCPFCGMGANVMEKIARNYPNDVKFVYKFFPLPGHNLSRPAGKATLAAGKQGKFWEMRDMIFNNQDSLKETSFDEFAKSLNIDLAKFQQDLGDPEFDKIMDDDVELGASLGINGTPAFFVNGITVMGAQPLEKFRNVIDKALAVN